MSLLRNMQESFNAFLEKPLTLKGGFFFFFLYVVLVAARIPSILIEGRFWCEEGGIFFHNAMTLSPFQAIFCSYGGYLNLPVTLSTFLAAKLFPLAYAPYFTTFVGLVFQCFPALLLLTAKEIWLQTAKDKLICLLTLLLVPLASECWMQSLHTQIWLDLCCALIVCLTPARGGVQFFRYFCLAVTAIAGLGCVAFMPLFLLRTWCDRRKEYLFSGIILFAGAVIEILYFYHPFVSRAAFSTVLFWPLIFLSRDIFVPFLSAPLLGKLFCSFLAKFVTLNFATKSFSFFISILLGFGLAALLWKLFRNKKYQILFWVLAANICFLGIVLCGAMGELYYQLIAIRQERYFFVGQALSGLFIAILYILSQNKKVAYLLCWILLVGIFHYFLPYFQSNNPKIFWKSEVQHWHQDAHYQLYVWSDFPWAASNAWHLNLASEDYKFWPCYIFKNPSVCQK